MDRYGNGEEMVMNRVFDSGARVPSFRNFDKELFTGDLLTFKLCIIVMPSKNLKSILAAELCHCAIIE